MKVYDYDCYETPDDDVEPRPTLRPRANELRALLRDVLRYSPAVPYETAEAEREDIAAAKAGDGEAFMRLLRAYAPRLRKMTAGAHAKNQDTAPDEDELAAAVEHTLLTAIHRFDPERGERLAAVLGDRSAARVTADEMLSAPSRMGVNIPTRVLHRFYAAVRAADPERKLDFASAVDAAVRTDAGLPSLSTNAMRSIQDAVSVQSYVYLNEDLDDYKPWDWFAKVERSDSVEDPRYTATVEATVETKLLAAVALSVLDECQTEVVRRAYGFAPEAYKAMTDAEVAEDLKAEYGYSRRTVGRIRNSALTAMRGALGVEVEE